MNKIIVLLFSIFFISCSSTKKTNQVVEKTIDKVVLQSDKELVKAAFNGYKTGILNDRGAEAVEFVDSKTIAYYTNILQKSKSADSITINKMNILDKLMVFSIRHRTPKEDLLSFDGKKLLIYAIKEGMVGKSSVANVEIGEVTIDNKFATGQLVNLGVIAPFSFHFYKENKQWKIDLTSLFPIATTSFQTMADASDQPVNDYLFMLLKIISGTEPGAEIWNTIE